MLLLKTIYYTAKYNICNISFQMLRRPIYLPWSGVVTKSQILAQLYGKKGAPENVGTVEPRRLYLNILSFSFCYNNDDVGRYLNI